MSSDSSNDQTTPHGCGEGIRLALRAQDHGEWQPLAEWLVRNPRCAEAVAVFLGDDGGMRRVFTPAPAPARVGAILGEYELCEEIGRGAMGTVYRAIDRRIWHEVAVKVVCIAGLSPAELARVRFEAEAMAALNHPNVVPLFAYGETDTELYFAMSLMGAGSLAGRLKELGPDRRYRADDAAKLVGEIALGVHHAHQRLLIHRDLKPANILLDKDGAPKIADFGLARRVDVTASIAGGIAGTFAYMAPEQACGDKQLTTAVDIHALGAILFELLTGGVPYRGDVASIVRKLTDPHDRAPVVSTYRADVPADLEAICQKCLERDPNHRYASALELAEDLGRFLQREPVLVRPRGFLADLFGALRWEQKTESMASWPGFAFGVFNHMVTHGLVAALLFAGSPRAALVAVVGHLFTWVAAIWWFGIRRRAELNAIERFGVVLMIGMILAIAATIPLVVALGPNVALIYVAYNVAIGVGSFCHGAVHRGRHYLIGCIWLSQNLLLPFLPGWAWPALHALVGSAIQAWVALAFWHAHRTGQAAPD